MIYLLNKWVAMSYWFIRHRFVATYPGALPEKHRVGCASGLAFTRQCDGEDWTAMHTVGQVSFQSNAASLQNMKNVGNGGQAYLSIKLW